jgi:hypothetical protein
MFKKEFNFTDYNGNEKKATYWFSLEKDEMLKRELGSYGGLEHTMKRMMKEERPDQVLDMLEDIVLSAVGEISPDGESFYKNAEIRDRFRQTKVCHDLLFELMSDENALRDFILGAIPAEISAKMLAEEGTEVTADASH